MACMHAAGEASRRTSQAWCICSAIAMQKCWCCEGFWVRLSHFEHQVTAVAYSSLLNSMCSDSLYACCGHSPCTDLHQAQSPTGPVCTIESGSHPHLTSSKTEVYRRCGRQRGTASCQTWCTG